MKRKYLLENEISYSREEKRAFLERLRAFTSFKNEIYRSKKLKEISSSIGEMIEAVEGFTINETQDGWFDNITVSRDLKRIKESYKMFQKTANEIHNLQQRLESCYEDMGSGLSRYYDI